jgi:hypothetical protein
MTIVIQGNEMVERGHLVTIPKGRGSSDVSVLPPQTDEKAPASALNGSESSKAIQRKILVIMIVVPVVVASGLFLWTTYVREWSTYDVAKQVISDPSLGSPGFTHSLAGRIVTVGGKLTNIETIKTSQGDLSFLTLNNFSEIRLVVWGDVPYKIDKRMSMGVHFEWATCNEERHVYSPQIDFPWFVLPAIGSVQDAVSATSGMVFSVEDTATGRIYVRIFDQYPPVTLANANCTLSAGTSSFTSEYIDVMSGWGFGRKLDSIDNMTKTTSANGSMTFSDADHNGLFSRGDFFELNGIEKPQEDSGVRTYLLMVGRTNATGTMYDPGWIGMTYLVVMHRGLVMYEHETPAGRFSVAPNIDGVKLICQILTRPVSWDNVSIGLMDGVTFVSWDPSSGALDQGSACETYLGAQKLGSLDVMCTVGDVSGNGMLDEGDYYVFAPVGGPFSATTNYSTYVIHEPTLANLAHAISFSG